ncbi:MAG: NAD-dependent DNA ligase LigA [Spirochaetia bacterium]|nr:NAD-dependent DNA ligase LigA [Spirochaetia bacterium]
MDTGDQQITARMDGLIEELNSMNTSYAQGTPEVSDQTYDALYETLLQLEREHPDLVRADSPTLRVGSDLSADLPEVPHTIPVLSLDKAYAESAITSWMERIEKRVEQQLSFVIEEKIDGVSIVLYYEDGLLVRAVTRGNGYVGNDVTSNVRTIREVPLRLKRAVTVAVRGEIFLTREDFRQLNSTMEIEYANPRNLTAGTIRRIRSSEVARLPLRIFVYEGFFSDGQMQPETHAGLLDDLRLLGFIINPRYHICSSSDALTGYLEDAARERGSLPYEIDGLVIKVNEFPVRESLGYTGHHPRWAIAYKFEAPMAESVVTAIDVQIGRTGRATPVARIEPVLIGGSTVSNVTLHNQDYVELLELCIGDTVSVSKRGDVIPAVERVIEKNEQGNRLWHMPERCPSCGGPLIRQGAHHFCTDHDCPDQVYGRLTFFVGKGQMDIDGLGSETIRTLISRKLARDPADLYHIDYEQLISEPGFGPKKVQQISKSIRESLDRPYEVVLRSLGIPEVGKKASQLLIKSGIRSIDQLIELAQHGEVEQLTGIRGFGEKTAQTIIREFSDPAVLEQIEELKAVGLSFCEQQSEQPALPQVFTDQVWCVTGSFEHYQPRSIAEKLIEARGGRVVSSVTGKTTHLLAGSSAGSKLAKAQKLGVRIVAEQEFTTMLEDVPQ